MKKLIVAAGVLLLSASAAQARGPQTFYVSDASDGTGAVGSLTKPYKQIVDAISAGAGSVDGDEIDVGIGTYNGTVNFPDLSNAITGVTIKGGYIGWTVASPTFNTTRGYSSATTLTSSGQIASLDNKSVIDGFNMVQTGTGVWAFYFNDASGAVLNNTISLQESGFLFWGNSSGRIALNTVTKMGGGRMSELRNPSSVVMEDNQFKEYNSSSNFLFINAGNTRAVLRRNVIEKSDSNYFITGYGHLIAVQNAFIQSEWNAAGGTAFYPYGSDTYWVVRNNNFTGMYWAFDEELWQDNSAFTGWYTPDVLDFSDNALFNIGGDEGAFYSEYYPRSGLTATGNCIQNDSREVVAYLDTEGGPYSYVPTVADLNRMQPEVFSGNSVMTSLPASNTSPACGGTKGKIAGTVATKPIAKGYAEDDTGGTYSMVETAVHPYQTVYLYGGSSINFESGDLTYKWTKISGPAITLFGDSGTKGNVVYGSDVTAWGVTPGTYKVQLEVKNGNPGNSNAYSTPFIVTFSVMAKVVLTSSTGAVRGSYTYVQEAVHAAQPGDTITLPAGVYSINQYVWNRPDGQAHTEDVVEVYGKNNLTIQGAGKGAGGTVVKYHDWTAFDIEYGQNITVRNMAIIDAEEYDSENIYGYEASIALDNVRLESAYDEDTYGIYMEYGKLTVTNSEFNNIEYGMEFYYSGSLSVTNSKFIDNSYEGVYASFDEDGNNNNVVIANNLFDAKLQGWDEQIYLGDIYAYQNPAMISGNEIRNFDEYGIEVYDAYGQGSVISDNKVWNDFNWMGFSEYNVYIDYGSSIIKNNVLSHNYYSIIFIDGNGASSGNDGYGTVLIENNVIQGSEWYYGIENINFDCSTTDNGWSVDDTSTCRPNTHARNNVFYANTEGDMKQVDDMGGNLLNTNPHFANANSGDFSLTAASPEILSTMGVHAAPGVPQNLSGTVGEAAVSLAWDPVEGATGYVVHYGEKASDLSQSASADNNQTSITGLANMSYTFAVAAVNANGEGRLSASIALTPISTAVEQSKPEVNGVFPYRFELGSKVELEITGAGFHEGAKVMIGSVALDEVVVVDENTIKATTNKDVRYGIQPVVVVNTDLGRGALSNGVVVYRPGEDTSGGCSSVKGSADLALFLLPFAALWLRRRRS